MSIERVPSLRRAFLLLFAGVIALFASNGIRAADILDDFKNDRKLAADKLEKEVDAAMLQVKKLASTEPAKALGILKTYKHILDSDTFLTKERRSQLLSSVSQRIEQMQGAVAAQEKAKTATPKKNSVDELYNKYAKYSQGGTSSSGAYNTASKRINDINQRLAKAKAYNNLKDKNISQILSSIDYGDVPSNGYVSFGKDFKALSDLRAKTSGLQLTKEEAKLLKTMNSVLSLNIDRKPFRDVIDYLGERTGMTIFVDPNTLKEALIEYDTPVSLKANKITVRTALKKILGDVGLAYVLRDGIVQVVTPERAREMMVVRSYYVADLLPLADPRFGYFFNQAREQYFANQIMQMIVMTVEPQSWAINGGKATLWYNAASKSIVVRNSAELHLSLKSGIGR